MYSYTHKKRLHNHINGMLRKIVSPNNTQLHKTTHQPEARVGGRGNDRSGSNEVKLACEVLRTSNVSDTDILKALHLSVASEIATGRGSVDLDYSCR